MLGKIKMNSRILTSLSLLFSSASNLWGATVPVEAKRHYTETSWITYPTQTLSGLEGFQARTEGLGLDEYGGRTDKSLGATGFFRTEKKDGRWWFVDPLGHPFLSAGVAVLQPGQSAVARSAFTEKFVTLDNWALQTTRFFREHGLNSLGAWSNFKAFKAETGRLPYTNVMHFMHHYAVSKNKFPYPNDLMPLFDPDFESFCDRHAESMVALKDDPYLIGHFSDNELPFNPRSQREPPLQSKVLDGYLRLPPTDHGHMAAKSWYQRTFHREAPADLNQLSNEERDLFRDFVMERYFQITSAAMRKKDPNHLILGSRFLIYDNKSESLIKIAGKYVDVLSFNYYSTWTPDPQIVGRWTALSGRPVVISEFYAKGMDTGFPNEAGAGWTVHTQADRGRFFENYVLGLIAQGNIVGWHWFQYLDNDPADTGWNPATRDTNKGILRQNYEPYSELVESIKRVNNLKYELADFFQIR